MITLSVGISGSGKTYGVRREVFAAVRRRMPVIVIDRMYEWGAPKDMVASRVARGARSVRQAREMFQLYPGTRLVIVRDRKTPVADQLNEACRWAIKMPGMAGVACAEAHRAAPCMGAMPEYVEQVATAWRHHQVTLWVDTQRMALISKTLTEQATLVKLYAIGGARDLAVVSATWGDECKAAVLQCAAKIHAGERGWHVPLGSVRLPPFRIARDK